MKKFIFACAAIILVMIGGKAVFAQETGAEGSGQQIQAEPQAQEGPRAQVEPRVQSAPTQPGSVGGEFALARGKLSFHGMFLAGARTRMQNQEGWDKDGNWALDGINAIWEENRADLYLNYSLSNFGAFLGLRAQQFGPNNFGYGLDSGSVAARYVFVYANFGPAKVSVGKLYDEILTIPGSKVWKSEGPGDSHRFTDEENYSMRFEFKIVEGLNFGAQWFFPQSDYRIDGRDDISGFYAKGLADSDAWKEIGLGASYTSSLFNAQLGVRFDSNADRFNKLDTGPQGAGTYLPHYYGKTSLLSASVPATAVAFSSFGGIGDGMNPPKYKHLDEIVKTNVDMSTGSPVVTAEYLPYDGGTYAFFGFNFKGVENLTATAHGGLYNLGAFDKFGYGRFSEFIKYNNIIPKLGVGITMQQEFYGSDVWPDDKVNSPFLQFGPQVSYAIITIPQMPMPLLQATVEAYYGVCPDVLDAYVKVKPAINFSLGTFAIDLFYEMELTDFTESANIKTMTRHTVGLGMMLLF
ncbi:hypothetical protein FACS189479_02200 [Spirochaetia bacterium]|nr:hypothetical protein FACS189479_02200 [Spirochaetia bacterium]